MAYKYDRKLDSGQKKTYIHSPKQLINVFFKMPFDGLTNVNVVNRVLQYLKSCTLKEERRFIFTPKYT